MSNRRKSSRRRGMFETRPGQHRPNNIRNGTIFVALIALLLVVIYLKPTVPGFGTKGTEFTAQVANAINVRAGSTPIRVQGVEAGTVTKVERNPSGRGAILTMLVEEGKGVEVRKDASLSLRWRTLLGRNLYVDLEPGSKSAPPIGDAPIPQDRTEIQTELDQGLEPFDDQGRKAVKTVIDEFDKGFASPTGYKQTVRSLGPAMQSLGPGLRSIRGTEPGDLQRMITNTSRVMGSLARDEVALGNLIDDGSVALGVTAARASDMRALLSSAPGALRETRATMARLRTTLDVVDPVAKKLRPGAREIEGSADDATTLLNAAAPLLRDAKPTVLALRPAVNDLTKLTTSGNELMAQANPALDQAIFPILPWLRTTSKTYGAKQYEMIGPAVATLGGVHASGDTQGTFANFEAGAGENVISGFSPCKTFISEGSVPLDKKVQCDLAASIIASGYTNTPIGSQVMRGRAAPKADLLKFLKDKPGIAKLAKSIASNNKKGASR